MLWDVRPSNQDVFVKLFRKAVAVRPDIAKNWETLAHHLQRSGKHEEAFSVLNEAIQRLPNEPKLHLTLAQGYHRAKRSDLAREVLDQVPPLKSDERATTIFYHELLMSIRPEKGLSQLATETLALDPTNSSALSILGKISRETDKIEIMIPICQAALQREPFNNQARYELAVAFAMTGRTDEARRLIDLEQFVTVMKLPTPVGFANDEELYSSLAEEIARNPTLRPDPVSKATRRGFQTMDGLPHTREPAISALLDAVRLAVDKFHSGLDQRSDDPFVKGIPKQAQLNAWAVVYPADGHQIAHIHPDGWLSGVYYIRTPQASDDDSRNGCLMLGALKMKDPAIHPPWGTRDIRPIPGRLVLFPSYIPHATIPTRANGDRVCISFDVIPCSTQ